MKKASAPVDGKKKPLRHVIAPEFALVYLNAWMTAVRQNPGPHLCTRWSAATLLNVLLLSVQDPARWTRPLAAIAAAGTAQGPTAQAAQQQFYWDIKRRIDMLPAVVQTFISIVTTSGRADVRSFDVWAIELLLQVASQLNIGYEVGTLVNRLLVGPAPSQIVAFSAGEKAPAFGEYEADPTSDPLRTDQFAGPAGRYGTYMVPLPADAWVLFVAASLMILDAPRLTLRILKHHNEIDGLVTAQKPIGEAVNLETILRSIHAVPVWYIWNAQAMHVGVTHGLWKLAAGYVEGTDPRYGVDIAKVTATREKFFGRSERHPLVTYMIDTHVPGTISSVYEAGAPLGVRVGRMAGPVPAAQLADSLDMTNPHMRHLCHAARAVTQLAHFATPRVPHAHDEQVYEYYLYTTNEVSTMRRSQALTTDPLTAQSMLLGIGDITQHWTQMYGAMAYDKVTVSAPLELNLNGGEFALTDGVLYDRANSGMLLGYIPVLPAFHSSFGGLSARRQDVINTPLHLFSVLEVPAREASHGDVRGLFRLQIPASASMGRDGTYLVHVELEPGTEYRDWERGCLLLYADLGYALLRPGVEQGVPIPAADGPLYLAQVQGQWETQVIAPSPERAIEAYNTVYEPFRVNVLGTTEAAAPPPDDLTATGIGLRYVMERRKHDDHYGVRVPIIQAWDLTAEAYDHSGEFAFIIHADSLVTFDLIMELNTPLPDAASLVGLVKTIPYNDGGEWAEMMNTVTGGGPREVG